MTTKTKARATRKGNKVTFPYDVPNLGEAASLATSLLEDDEHLVRQSASTFTVGAGRNGAIASRAMEGETYSVIGADFGISGERVRQIADTFRPEGGREMRQVSSKRHRREKAQEAARRYAEEHPEASIPEIAQAVPGSLDNQAVIEALGAAEAMRRPMHRTFTKPTKFTDEDFIAALRHAATDKDGNLQPISMGAYDNRRRPQDPSPHAFPQRFGSWRAACETAGVESKRTGRATRTWARKWTEPQLRAAATRFFTEVGPSGTAAQYNEWSKATPGVPPLSTMRSRLGSWSAVRESAALAAAA